MGTEGADILVVSGTCGDRREAMRTTFDVECIMKLVKPDQLVGHVGAVLG
jgi:hypothetical protein